MAITLQELCEKASYRYGMRVLAGEGGMKNIVSWVHTIEDEQTCEFLHGNELIFTTGIAHNDGKWLTPFIKKLKVMEIAGLVLNYGPYITQAPQEMIDYCNEERIPLLEVPWKTRLVDITRDFCNQIIQNEKVEEDIGEAFQTLIFHSNHTEQYIPMLEKRGFDANGRYCVLGIQMIFTSESHSNAENVLIMKIERRISKATRQSGFFKMGSCYFLILNNYSDGEVKQIVTDLESINKEGEQYGKVMIAVSSNKTLLKDLHKNYQRILAIFHLEQNQKESVFFYDDCGMKKLLLSVDDHEVLEQYFSDFLGKLTAYDEENHTNYVEMLQKYILYDGSVQRVAKETFIHRNTVNYQLVKIRKIIGHDISTFEERFNLMLAFQIKSML